MKQYEQDIHERIYRHVLEVLRFIKALPRSYVNQVIVSQLLRSITSMGANDQEANGTSTKADFMHCYTIVRKEGNESIYWIRLLGDINHGRIVEANPLVLEGNEIVRVVSAIIYNTKKKLDSS